MLNKAKHFCLLLAVFLFSFTNENPGFRQSFPYKEAGLTERQAAAHLLDRFTFGTKNGQVDEVVKMGLEQWFGQQLTAKFPDEELNEMLARYTTTGMTNEQIVKTFPKGGKLLKMAIQDGAIEKNSVKKEDKAAYRKTLSGYMLQNGYRRQRELYQELISQKILRAAYSQNQLEELLTSFWFNHFNVSLTDKDCSRFITAYERDAIRPNALGKFEDLLLATAKSPAMLTYLDNFKSAAPAEPVSDDKEQPGLKILNDSPATQNPARKMQMEKLIKAKKPQGINENYAREIMELHTLGVDGGFTQEDVTQAARIFTGWTIYPGLNDYFKKQKVKNKRPANFSKNGFVRDGDFLFAVNKHDQGEKVVMKKKFPANGGYEEGEELIKMLAQHPATARFISYKLAVRFVNDNPPLTLVDKMAKTFIRSEGDIKQVLTTLVSAPEFWSREAIREKTKSPFELAISSVRGLHAVIKDPFPLSIWIAKMGEKMYAYQAPTGFPDNGRYWINTGSLLTRMNFGLALASQNIAGIEMNLAGLHQNHEPESAEEALRIYSHYLMPERDLAKTIERLMPAINDPELAQVVGIVIGSPEFQRK